MCRGQRAGLDGEAGEEPHCHLHQVIRFRVGVAQGVAAQAALERVPRAQVVRVGALDEALGVLGPHVRNVVCMEGGARYRRERCQQGMSGDALVREEVGHQPAALVLLQQSCNHAPPAVVVDECHRARNLETEVDQVAGCPLAAAAEQVEEHLRDDANVPGWRGEASRGHVVHVRAQLVHQAQRPEHVARGCALGLHEVNVRVPQDNGDLLQAVVLDHLEEVVWRRGAHLQELEEASPRHLQVLHQAVIA
mmetsp:Transcript_19444/g.52325  ORF Transcript_19444/g.52325 Transcript_19444/m.52325 type:complete len:250 (-) Transcript_19444:994-1743(-)